MKNYVGITGLVKEYEVKSVIKKFSKVGYTLKSNHIPMMGFLVSYKTLNGEPTLNKRYPKIQDLPKLLEVSKNKALNMIHYNSRKKSTLATQIRSIFKDIYPKNLCQALQLNMVWPETKQVKKIKDYFPEMKIVFQASQSILEKNTPQKMVSKIKRYGTSIDYVLIDPSAGRGVPFDMQNSLDFYNEISEKLSLKIGFAGGFDEENVGKRLEEIIYFIESHDFCIDVEGGVRDKLSKEYGDDVLNLTKVRDYLKNSFKALR